MRTNIRPQPILQVEVELVHPALLVLQMRAVVVLISDGDQNARRFTRLHDRYYLVGLGVFKVWIQQSISPAVVIFGGEARLGRCVAA
jgi:hypothetical protein